MASSLIFRFKTQQNLYKNCNYSGHFLSSYKLSHINFTITTSLDYKVLLVIHHQMSAHQLFPGYFLARLLISLSRTPRMAPFISTSRLVAPLFFVFIYFFLLPPLDDDLEILKIRIYVIM